METAEKGTVYEVSYLLLPSISQEQIESKATALKETIKKNGGEIISDDNPILIDLAYPMTKVVSTVSHKCHAGYFGWIKFELRARGLSDLKKSLDNNNDILRYLIIKTVRENTLLNGKMKLKSEDKTRKYEDEKESTPEEIDKSIDNLVVV